MSLNEVVLGDILEVLIDHRGKTPKKLGGDFIDHGVPVVSAANVKSGRIDLSERVRYVTEAMYERWMPIQLRAGDVLLTSEAPLGQVAQVAGDEPLVLGQRLFALRGQQGVVDNDYLANLLRWNKVQQRLQARSSGSTVAGIRQSELVRVVVDLPSLDIQMRISAVLNCLDRKVELNEVLNHAVTGYAASILQEAAVQNRPRVLLGAIAEVRRGLSYQGAGLAQQGMPLANLANAARFGGFKRSGWKYYTGAYKPRHVVKGGELLVANTDLTWKLEALGWPMLVPDDVAEALFSHHMSLVDFRPEWRHMLLPVWAHLFTRAARRRIEGMAYGTTVAVLGAGALTGLAVPTFSPDAPILAQSRAMLARAWAAERETAAVGRLRDALLPALMSGELHVHEAEEHVEEVT